MASFDSTSSTTARRLPGIFFEMRRPPLSDILPRMDVAIFVGFATHGPLNTPYAVEDETEFTTVFGEDVLLAWDVQQGTPVYGYLAPAVRSFFRNGGKRCWVIRVAGPSARYNYFPVSGLVRIKTNQAGDVVEISPAFAHACSEGSWSDGLSTSTMLTALPITISPWSLPEQVAADKLSITITPNPSSDVMVGDLLRLTYTNGLPEEYTQMVVVDAVSNHEEPGRQLQRSRLVDISGTTVRWLKKYSPVLPSSPPAALEALIYHCERAEDSTSLLPQMRVSATSCPLVSSPAQYDLNGSQCISLVMVPPANDVPVPGMVLAVSDRNTDEQFWMTVLEVHETHDGNPEEVNVQVVGEGLQVLPCVPSLPPGCTVTGEQLSFSLWTQQRDGTIQQMDALTFDMRHPDCWNALAIDAQYYRTTDKVYDPVHQDLWQKAAVFPLAGNYDEGEVYIPIGMPSYFPDYVLNVDQLPVDPDQTPALPLERDGLSVFDASLFLDRELIYASVSELLDQADLILAQNDYARPLNGIYAALYINEVTLIAIPDAIHRGWAKASDDAQIGASRPYTRQHESRRGSFHDCLTDAAAPSLAVQPEKPVGPYTLSWTPASAATGAGARYVLEESVTADFGKAVQIYEGKELSITLYGRDTGNYYYRVQQTTPTASDWSGGIMVHIGVPNQWRLRTVEEFDVENLVTMQRALLRMCAARGDLFAVLSLPAHYYLDQAEAYVETLKQNGALTKAQDIGRLLVQDNALVLAGLSNKTFPSALPLNYGERIAFTYGALYHPWLIFSQETLNGALNTIPPDGAICGLMAQISLDPRAGAWIAPANQLLSGIVALTPHIDQLYYERMMNAQVNIIRDGARGTLVFSQDTLCDEHDADYRAINVRRLLMLLRRLALSLGPNYVFEPNSAAFRRAVQRSLEALLMDMFIRGAFVGDTPAASFQVVCDDTVNKSGSVEAGKFIVELRVAPSLPMTYLTIRLIQTATGSIVTES